MSDGGSSGERETDAAEPRDPTWPVELDGVVESIVATRGPNERWNFAALGLRPGGGREANSLENETDTALAYTWGRTRTWRNFRERGAGYVQFAHDPVLFVEATLGLHERDDPIHPATDAWVRVAATSIGVETVEDTRRETWRLRPVEGVVETRRVPRTRRGYAAVVEATVAASRLDVPSYDTAVLRERLEYFEQVIERCGDDRERAAMARLGELIESS